ncbi:MAG TPA: DNA glycosylase [Clostridiales bacterium]|nr:DNA glycosylase [Clostridiales bacterium]
MEVLINSNTITIYNPNSFDIKHILECGQVFRYFIAPTHARVLSQNHCADVIKNNHKIVIHCDDAQFFYNFFDLDKDYNFIKKAVSINPLMKKAVNFGQGIRILKNDFFEMIISFIISANNNIGRIKKTLNFICQELGQNMGDYYAFPKLEVLAQAPESFFRAAGCGYRSPHLTDTLNALKDNFVEFYRELKNLSTHSASKKLSALKGVGEKVADCILLFGLQRYDVFPVDVWISKVYKENFGGELTSTKAIRRFFIDLFGDLAGYAQQYLFYYKRSYKV